MIKRISKFIALSCIFIIWVSACKTKTPESKNEAEEEAQVAASEHVNQPTGFTIREPSDEELNEFGIIETLEDAGYPLYNVTVSFPEREMSSNFLLNVESASLSDDISSFQDQYATIYYESEESTEVLDIIFNGTSLLGEYAPEDHEGLERFDGILKGAGNESGDLPNALEIEGEDGILAFEYFVDAATMAVNNQQITAYYYKRYVDKISYLELSDN